jgi:hypothetical protein
MVPRLERPLPYCRWRDQDTIPRNLFVAGTPEILMLLYRRVSGYHTAIFSGIAGMHGPSW